VDEAHRAENHAAQAGNRLRDDLTRHSTAEAIQADLDRLELAARDLQRRAEAVHDITSAAKESQELASEIERLHTRSKAWLDYVQAARRTDPAAQVAGLDDLIHSPAAPATSAKQ
jgi:hypothetical protein